MSKSKHSRFAFTSIAILLTSILRITPDRFLKNFTLIANIEDNKAIRIDSVYDADGSRLIKKLTKSKNFKNLKFKNIGCIEKSSS